MMSIFLRSSLRLGSTTKEFGREKRTTGLFLQMKKLDRMPSTGWRLKSGANNLKQVEKPGPITSNWWELTRGQMTEIESGMHLLELLKNAGNKLVVVQFYTPFCGGCRALHPMMHQIAKENREVMILNVNLEMHKLPRDTFLVHAVPFFHFYRGTQGRVHSFSCTVGTIHKMKNALKKYGNEQIGPEPEKGLDDGNC